MRIKVSGLKDMIGALEEMPKDIKRAALRAVYDDAVEVFKESQELVPVLTGDLRKSGRLTPPTMSDPNVEISYDDIKATIVHENVLGHVFKHGKQSHYLMIPYTEVFESPAYGANLEQQIYENMAKGKDIRGLKGRKGSRGPLAKKGDS